MHPPVKWWRHKNISLKFQVCSTKVSELCATQTENSIFHKIKAHNSVNVKSGQMKIPKCTSSCPKQYIPEVSSLQYQWFQSYARHKLKIPYFHKIKAHNSVNVKSGQMKIPRCTSSCPKQYIPEVSSLQYHWFQSYARHKLNIPYFHKIKGYNSVNENSR